jgi:hypothetical protein
MDGYLCISQSGMTQLTSLGLCRSGENNDTGSQKLRKGASLGSSNGLGNGTRRSENLCGTPIPVAVTNKEQLPVH